MPPAQTPSLFLHKYEGAGNDFLLLEQKAFQELFSPLIQQLCHRQYGLGADGLVCYSQLGPHKWRMVIYNRDGSRAGMCGNALRCLGAHLWHMGYESGEHILVSDFGEHRLSKPSQIPPSSLAKPLWGEISWVKSSMGDSHEMKLDLKADFIDPILSAAWLNPAKIRHIDWLNTGVPHLLFVAEEDSSDLMQLGRFWRWHPHLAPEGANISVVRWDLPSNSLHISTYERGVEAPTLACGTGACAAAISFWMRHQKLPYVYVHYQDQLPMLLEKELSPKPPKPQASPFHVTLTGPARLVFEGCIRALNAY